MFELRGKCNDDECPWQHVRDNSCRNLNIDNAIEGEVLETAPGMMAPDATKFSKSSDLLGFAPPSYLVCSDIMKADDSYDSWNRQSSYFHSTQGMSQPNQHLIDIDESLDMALVILGQEANKQKGRIEALKVLARALEADPKSAVLWIVYFFRSCSAADFASKKCRGNPIEHKETAILLCILSKIYIKYCVL
ncbi:hypothetical protein POM88_013414 [Heracleum sosnowskyi]|uniref:Putative zinc-finger domain-containing protein n=1 Tax=Heracleum sosnowskyi TaxID=360622 RepID=A0AAD8IZU7_9APIA|nr:hypothetical protein POM88_013414 [Heracleum sosnowskyi]